MPKRWISGLAVLIANTTAMAQSYQVVDLGPMDANYNGAVGSGIANGQQVGWAFYVGPGAPPNLSHAVLWNGSGGSFTDLQPATGWLTTSVNATNGTWQVGAGEAPNISGVQALLWQGSADSLVNLTPAGATQASATGISGEQIAGYAYFPTSDGTASYAVIWNGPNHTMVNLGVGTLDGTDGVNQVGASVGGAAMWSGTTDSLVLLGQGSGYTQSVATAVAGNQEVGYGIDSQNRARALVWYGGAASVVDLTPPGVIGAAILGTNGTEQVGVATIQSLGDRAILWFGSPDNYIDLTTLLPGDFNLAKADAIDNNGDIIVSANSPTEGNQVFLFMPVPEPSILALFCGLGAILNFKRRARS